MRKEFMLTENLLRKLQSLLEHLEERELWSDLASDHNESTAFSSPFNIDRLIPFNWRGRSSLFTPKKEN